MLEGRRKRGMIVNNVLPHSLYNVSLLVYCVCGDLCCAEGQLSVQRQCLIFQCMMENSTMSCHTKRVYKSTKSYITTRGSYANEERVAE